MKNIEIYTDGSSRGNPGPGGWAYILNDGEKILEMGGFEEFTTNNRMELLGVINSLKKIDETISRTQDKDNREIIIHSDSAYVINGITKWVKNWERNDWKTKTGDDVSNRDLWETLSSLIKGKKIIWSKVSGHSGVDLNERCDYIATGSAMKEKIDLYNGDAVAYLNKIKNTDGFGGIYYISFFEGKVGRYKTWSKCEKFIKGKSGAKYKKVKGRLDEEKVLSTWR